MDEFLTKEYDPKEADYRLRETISNIKGQIDQICFGFLDRFSPGKKQEFIEKLSYTLAGHPDQYLLNAGTVQALSGRSILIGAVKDSDFKETHLDFPPGSRLFLFSDGIFEEFAPGSDNELGEEKLAAFIRQHNEKPLADFIDGILGDVKQFLEDAPWNDDVSIIGVEYA